MLLHNAGFAVQASAASIGDDLRAEGRTGCGRSRSSPHCNRNGDIMTAAAKGARLRSRTVSFHSKASSSTPPARRCMRKNVSTALASVTYAAAVCCRSAYTEVHIIGIQDRHSTAAPSPLRPCELSLALRSGAASRCNAAACLLIKLLAGKLEGWLQRHLKVPQRVLRTQCCTYG